MPTKYYEDFNQLGQSKSKSEIALIKNIPMTTDNYIGVLGILLTVVSIIATLYPDNCRMMATEIKTWFIETICQLADQEFCFCEEEA